MSDRFRKLARTDVDMRPVWEHHDRHGDYVIVVVEGPGYGWEVSVWLRPADRPDAAYYVYGGSPHPRGAFVDVEEAFSFARRVIEAEIEVTRDTA